MEANVMWSSLPMREGDINRAVTFRDPTPGKVLATKDEKKPSQRDMEWQRVLDEVRETEMEKAAQKMTEKLQVKEPRWLTFLKGKSFNLNKDLTCSSSLVPPFCLHGSVPMVSAAVGRSTTSSTKDAGDA